MTRPFLLCAEDVLSATLARDLVDRVVHERARADWLRALWTPELRDSQRTWQGLRPTSWWADRVLVDRDAESFGIRGHIRDQETGRSRAMRGASGFAFKSLKVAALLEPRPELVVVAGDTDNEKDASALRAAGVAAAGIEMPSLVAEIRREAEAWVVCGFVPGSLVERDRLREVTHELGFDPTESPEKLMSTRHGDARDAKRVARFLLADPDLSLSNERLRSCWLDTPIELLMARGAGSGLKHYISQIESELLPLLGDEPR